MILEEMLCNYTQYLTAACRKESEEHRAETYQILVLKRNLRKVVWWIT